MKLQGAGLAAGLVVLCGLAAGGTYVVGGQLTADEAPRELAVESTSPASPLATPPAVTDSPSVQATAPPTTETVAPSEPITPPVAEPLPPPPAPVSALAIVEALWATELRLDGSLAGAPVSGPEDYIPVGDTVPSPRLVGGVNYSIDVGAGVVFAETLIYEDERDSAAEQEQYSVAYAAGGTQGQSFEIEGTDIECFFDPEATVCVAVIGRAFLMAQAQVPQEGFLEDAMRAAIRTLAAAREAAADA